MALFELRSSRRALTRASTPSQPQVPREKTPEELEGERRIAKVGRPPTPSPWDGTYSEVERYLKQIARDPDSVELDSCTEVRHSEDGWVVGCNWRGRNGFGGMNREANWFTIRDGIVIKMHEYAAFEE